MYCLKLFSVSLLLTEQFSLLLFYFHNQDVPNKMDAKRPALDDLLTAASSISAVPDGEESGDSEGAISALKETEALRERFEKLLAYNKDRLGEVDTALGKAEEFEQPFNELTSDLGPLEEAMEQQKEPITGMIEQTEQQLASAKVGRRRLITRYECSMPANVHHTCQSLKMGLMPRYTSQFTQICHPTQSFCGQSWVASQNCFH